MVAHGILIMSERDTNKKTSEVKIMAKRIWTLESALKVLAPFIVDLDHRVLSLKGQGNMTLCSAADYLTKTYAWILF